LLGEGEVEEREFAEQEVGEREVGEREWRLRWQSEDAVGKRK